MVITQCKVRTLATRNTEPAKNRKMCFVHHISWKVSTMMKLTTTITLVALSLRQATAQQQKVNVLVVTEALE